MFLYDNPRDALSLPDANVVVHTLSELQKRNRYLNQKSDLMVYRRKASHGVHGPAEGLPTLIETYEPARSLEYPMPKSGTYAAPQKIETDNAWAKGNAKLVYIDDEGLGFSKRGDKWSPFIFPASETWPTTAGMKIDDQLQTNKDLLDRCTKHIASTWFVIKANQWLDSDRSDLFNFLKVCNSLRRTILIISGESLRRGLTHLGEKPGIKLSKTVSWERTVEDFKSALDRRAFGELAAECGHIVVRLGMEGAIHVVAGEPSPILRLVFDPRRIEGEYAPTEPMGEFSGLTTVFSCSIVQAIVQALRGETEASNEIERAIENHIRTSLGSALQAVRRYFDLGYGPSHDTIRKFADLQLPISQVFKTGRIQYLSDDGIHRFYESDVTEVPSTDSSVDAARKSNSPPRLWSILTGNLRREPESLPDKKCLDCLASRDHEPDLFAAIRATELGRAIVLYGVDNAFRAANQPFPYATFKSLVTADRREIEGLRSARVLLSEYVRQRDRKLPISLAVFGPPGSGKSFAVRQIAASVADNRIREFTFNMAQFTSFAEVSRLLLQVRDASLEEKLPLVFFDEFDSPLADKPLGWLKFFLAPMQDGRFQHGDALFGIGRSIFVFAGGVASQHRDFNSPAFWDRETGRTGVFRAAKGPDFHSRLRGFLDICGPNPSDDGTLAVTPGSGDEPFAGDDFSFVVRRAILIRQMIEQIGMTSHGGILDIDHNAEVDPDILDAMLLTETYLHGVRSLEALFQMSAIFGERALIKTALPSKEQLLMHVDISFYHILRRDFARLKSGITKAVCEYLSLQYQSRLSANIVRHPITAKGNDADHLERK